MKSEKFKDVSIDTLPFTKCIPAHWRIVPLKYSLDILDYLREPITAGQRPQSNPIYDYYGASGVIDKIDFYNVDDKVLLIGEDGANLVLRNLPLVYKASGRFWVNNHAHILKPKFDDYDFMAYQLEAMDYYLYITGAAQPKLSQENLRKVRILQPPLVEQRAIVAYLDEKCGKIDRLVAAKENEVALLKELKQSMIAEAVTRGVRKTGLTGFTGLGGAKENPVNPVNPVEEKHRLVPSGIPWIPEVPEGWEVKRAKYLFQKEQRPVRAGDEIVTCFRDGEVTLRKNRRISGFTEATDYSHYQHIRAGDLVIHQMDAFAGSCGVSDSNGMGTPVLSVCTPKNDRLDVRYFAAVVRLMGLNGFIQSLYRGIRERSSDFRFETFAKQVLPVPPLAEQREIVAHIEARAAKIDAAVKGLEREVAALKEYKQRLIADVVTGQRKVA